MPSAGPNAASAHALPLELLEAVLELLPDVEDRARCMLVSRHFYAAATASRRLWRSVSVYGAGIASLERAAVRHDGLGIERLRWYVGARPASWDPQELLAPGQLRPLWASFLATVLAASGSLRSLSLQHIPEALAAQPLPALGCLTELDIAWRGSSTVTGVFAHTSLSGLSSLLSLSLSASMLADSCTPLALVNIPAQLAELSLCSLDLAQLPPVLISAAASLRHLCLESCAFGPRPSAWKVLSRLTALTTLGLVECVWQGGFALPAEVSALRRLEELYVIDTLAFRPIESPWHYSFDEEEEPPEPPSISEAFVPLAGLPALTSLTFRMPHLDLLPTAALQLPRLQVLHLAGTQAPLGFVSWDLQQAPIEHSNWAAQLRLVSMDELQALTGAEDLAFATCLTRLELGTAWNCVEDEGLLPFRRDLDDCDFCAHDVLTLLQVLLWLPALQRLCYLEPRQPTALPMLLCCYSECEQALEDLRAVRPRFAEVLFDEAPM